jgi:hypothetical protein
MNNSVVFAAGIQVMVEQVVLRLWQTALYQVASNVCTPQQRLFARSQRPHCGSAAAAALPTI